MPQTTSIPASVREAVAAALALLPPAMSGAKAECAMYAIGLQESEFLHRYQLPRNPNRPGAAIKKGPARGLWQFERGGGVRGVMTHPASLYHARRICELRDVPFEEAAIWEALEFDDVLAAAFARLLLWTDSRPLPAIGDVEGMWAYYLRNWRPGEPHKSKWPRCYAAAVEASDRRKGERA